MENVHSWTPKDLIESAIKLLLIVILFYAMYNTLSIFLGVFTFAIIFSVSFYSLFEKMVRWLRNKRKLAAFIYGILLISCVAVPFIFIISALANYLQDFQHFIAKIKEHIIPPLPDVIAGLPYVGAKATDIWKQLEADPAATISLYEPQVKAILQHLLVGGTGILGTGLELIVGIIISAIALYQGKKTLEPLKQVLDSLAGEQRGAAVIDASGRAIKGVAGGVMGTGFIAALAAYIGFAIAGIGFAPGLAALTFFLVVIQVGPSLIWITVAAWLGSKGETGWAIFIAIYGLVVLTGIDNILKPWLIGKSGKLPILVLFLGVVGGMAAWGFTGMFKGAVILAVVYTLFNSWFTHSNNKPSTVTAE